VKAKKKKSLRPLKLIILLLAVFALFIFILYLPVWRIKDVVVQGNKIVTSETIIQAADISMDENIFFINSREVRRRVKEIPQIKKADVFPKIPSSIFISVEERKPFAVFIAQGKYYIADNEGVIISKEETFKGSSDLPTVIGLSKSAIIDGKRIDEKLVRAVEKSYKVLSQLMPPNRFVVEMKDEDDISILINDILKVKIGSSSGIDNKLTALELLMSRISSKKAAIEYIDVRLPEQPVVKFR
jgi:cell division protein FtsQ